MAPPTTRWVTRAKSVAWWRPRIYTAKFRSEQVALKKSDLYSSLWKSCDELRGGMDASQYKEAYSAVS